MEIKPEFRYLSGTNAEEDMEPEAVKFFGLLMGYLLYHQVDKAAQLLLSIDDVSYYNIIKVSAGHLIKLCEIVEKDVYSRHNDAERIKNYFGIK